MIEEGAYCGGCSGTGDCEGIEWHRWTEEKVKNGEKDGKLYLGSHRGAVSMAAE